MRTHQVLPLVAAVLASCLPGVVTESTPPLLALHADDARSGGTIVVTFTPPDAPDLVSVVLLRRQDGACPASAIDRDAVTLVVGADRRAVDDTVVDGLDACYAGFALYANGGVSAARLAHATPTDQLAPAALASFAAVAEPDGSGIALSWPAPADADAVKLVRRADAPPSGIDDGELVATVSAADGLGAFLDDAAPPGVHLYYGAFPVDAAGNPGPAAVADATALHVVTFESLVVAKHDEGAGTSLTATRIAPLAPHASSGDDVVVTGAFSGPLDVGNGTVNPSGGTSAFALRLRADGSIAWTQTTGDSGYFDDAAALDDGRIVLAGTCAGTTTFGAGTPSERVVAVDAAVQFALCIPSYDAADGTFLDVDVRTPTQGSAPAGSVGFYPLRVAPLSAGPSAADHPVAVGGVLQGAVALDDAGALVLDSGPDSASFVGRLDVDTHAWRWARVIGGNPILGISASPLGGFFLSVPFALLVSPPPPIDLGADANGAEVVLTSDTGGCIAAAYDDDGTVRWARVLTRTTFGGACDVVALADGDAVFVGTSDQEVLGQAVGGYAGFAVDVNGADGSVVTLSPWIAPAPAGSFVPGETWTVAARARGGVIVSAVVRGRFDVDAAAGAFGVGAQGDSTFVVAGLDDALRPLWARSASKAGTAATAIGAPVMGTVGDEAVAAAATDADGSFALPIAGVDVDANDALFALRVLER